MAAVDYVGEVARGIRNSANPADDPMARCQAGGTRSMTETFPSRVPIIREWEYAAGPLLAFTTIDSCLGALQIVDDNRLRGAHFSMFASNEQYDTPRFAAAMRAAGFQAGRPILYFGGGVDDWMAGLALHGYVGGGQFPGHVVDAAQRRWIFATSGGTFTYHSMI